MFIVAKTSGDKSFTTYTGIKNVPTLTTADWTVIYKNTGKMASYVYVPAYAGKTSTGDEVMWLATSYDFGSAKDGSTTYYYREYPAIVNGEISTVKVSATSGDSISGVTNYGDIGVGKLQTPTYDSHTVATSLTSAVSAGASYNSGYGYGFSGGTLAISNPAYSTVSAYTAPEDTVMYFKDTDGNYTKGTLAEQTSDSNDPIFVVLKTGSTTDVDYVYVQSVDDASIKTLAFGDDTTFGDADDVSLTATAATQTVTVNGNADYYIYVVKGSAGDTVEFSRDGTNYYSEAGTSNGASYYAVKGSDILCGESETLWIKVYNADTEVVYTVTFEAPEVLTLASLTFYGANEGAAVAITPTFDSDVTEYTSTAVVDTRNYYISAITADDAANTTVTIKYAGGSALDASTATTTDGTNYITAASGSDVVITIVVKNNTTNNTKTYTITATAS